MATYVVVDKDVASLGPNELRAGDDIFVENGDVFIISDSVSDNIKFESATGEPTNFDVRIETSNSNDVQIPDVDIDADKALAVVLTAGDNVSLGHFKGSENGTDVLTIGDGFSTDHDIDLNGGDDFLSIGDNAIIQGIKTEDGTDSIAIGDDALVDDIKTGNGNDTVSVGDAFTADKVETGNGDDLVISGAGGSIDDLDGGNGNDTLSSDTDYPNASSFETICFAKGTHIETDRGLIEIEDLGVGDRVRTMDNSFQPIRWINSTAVAGRGILAPVRIAAGALGNARPLWVSQQHRMFLNSAEVELFFAESEVLIAAKNLLGFPGIDVVEVHTIQYFHMLFDQHEIVYAEGIPSESFFPGAVGLDTLSADACAEIYSLFPELERNSGSFGKPARSVLKPHEARILAA